MVEVKQEHEKCIGCGACAAMCPDNWEMGPDGKARPKDTKPKEVGCNKQAESVCPVKCIHVKE
ncbi:MAG: ferredoxin [Candidatus Diapherotrites archaeon]|nr:ferredoxin [Candidatus Diapherotrites archaeon]